MQEDNFKEADLSVKIEYTSTIRRKDAKTILRIAQVKAYPATEYTAFAEFDDFIFYCVMFTPENKSRQNLRKLENILETVLPIKVQANKSVN